MGTNYPPGSCSFWSCNAIVSCVLTVQPSPAPAKALLARAVSIASTAVIAVTLGGDALFPALGIRTPDFLKSMQASKLQTCAAAYFLGNTGAFSVRRYLRRAHTPRAVHQNLISTGAFEVSYDGRTLFSKLASGAVPQLADIVRAVSEAHRAALLA